MGHSRFVHLRVHSAYSLSEGAIPVKALVKRCQAAAMPAAAIADSGNLFGALEFALSAKDAGIQPIVACQLEVTPEDGKDDSFAQAQTRPAPDQLLLLAQNEAGYRNLLHLVSRSYLEGDPGDPPQVSMAQVAAASDGLIALTAGLAGAVGRLLLAGQQDAAETTLKALAEIFPTRLYVELQRHGLAEEAAVEERLIDLAYALDLPLVATNECFFEKEEDYDSHDALLCIAAGATVNATDRRRVTVEHRFKSAEEMEALFADLPEAVQNTLVIAERCAYFPDRVDPILPAFPTTEGRSESEELRLQSQEGLLQRLETAVYTAEMDDAAKKETAEPYHSRLAFELGVIEQMGFPGYFLIVSDFIKWAKDHDIPVGPGRGSGAGSVVAWALTITDLDPLRWGLLFERFLNPERVSMPDFDVDFCQERRDEVIQYVQQTYGRDHVAQIITFGKLQARAALRDVGRVMQMPYPQVDRICKLVPNNPASPVTLGEAIAGEPQLQVMRQDDPTVARLMEIALGIEGLYRHASTHAAGLVIGDRPLEELVPLYRDPRSDIPVTQFNMKFVEQAGLVKFDFLGLKTLTVLAKACQLIAATGESLDLAKIPLDDAKTYKMLERAETVGVFQLESSGMRDALRKLKPDRFEDIIAVVALYRPGPMDNIPSYIRRKHGEEECDYLHPSLEWILKETYGIMIYQEQVMQIAQELAGYSLGGADLLRRAMGKKIQAEMDAQRQTFVEGAVARKVPKAQAARIFEQVNKFAGYGFNKSHAAAYALVAYQTAYLKANHPVSFMAASMTYDMGNTDKLNVFRQELQRMGVPLLPPDINRSEVDFSVETEEGPPAIRYALTAVKNVGAAAMAAVVAERNANGPFASLADFVQRLDARQVNKRQIEMLASAGAFDSMNGNRHQVFQGAEVIVRHAAAAVQERESAQVNLFGGAAASGPPRLPLPAVEDWPALERLRQEFAAIGFYLSAHPLDAYQGSMEKLGVLTYSDLLAKGKGARCKLAGIVVAKRELTSRKGNRMAFVQCTDTSGVFEVTAFSEILSRARELFDSKEPLLFNLSVEWQDESDEPRLTLQDVEPMEQVAARATAGLKLFVQQPEPLQSVQRLLAQEEPGRGKVLLVLDLDEGQEVELELDARHRLSAATRQALKSIPGIVVQDL